MIYRSLSPALLMLAACGAEPIQTSVPESPETAVPALSSTPPATASASAPPPPAPAPMPLAIEPGVASPNPEKLPSLTIVSPKPGEAIPVAKANDYVIKLDLKDWETKAGGAHVHVILDGKPYLRIDDAKAPIKMKDLDPNGTLTEGEHLLVAFPSRHTHESVKPVGKATPIAAVPFFIGKKGVVTWKPTTPTLVYSRPKGKNDGPLPAEGLLVDWALLGAELGEGKFTIDATLTGPSGSANATFKSWTPHRVKNAVDGAYTLRLTLKGPDGKPVPGPMNDVTHPFSIAQSAPSDPHHAPVK